MKVSHGDFLRLMPEMRSVIKVTLLSFIAQVHAQELESIAKLDSSAWGYSSKVALKSIKHHLDLDRTSLAKTSDGVRGASHFTRAIIPPFLHSITPNIHGLPCPCPPFCFLASGECKRSPSLWGHKGTELNADHVSALPAPVHPSPPQLFQTGGVVFSCVEGGSKPECLNCPFFKSLGRPQDPSMPVLSPGLDDLVPPDVDESDDSTSDGGFNDQLSARTCTNIFCIIQILAMVLIGCKIVGALCFSTDEGLLFTILTLFSARSETFCSKTLLCPLLLTGV